MTTIKLRQNWSSRVTGELVTLPDDLAAVLIRAQIGDAVNERKPEESKIEPAATPIETACVEPAQTADLKPVKKKKRASK